MLILKMDNRKSVLYTYIQIYERGAIKYLPNLGITIT
jgi:hypothetical protein